MKRYLTCSLFLLFISGQLFSQGDLEVDGKIVFSNEDVVFHQIDDHTWVGSGHQMWHESLYLVEGRDKAVLIDAGTNIKNLDKIVASITRKPVLLVATHVHPDHTGSSVNAFPEIFINPGDSALVLGIMRNFKGEVKFLKDWSILDLGDRQLLVVFTPGHTKGSTTFIDKKAGYGFSGDSFGTGLLLLSVDFSTFIASCEAMCQIMQDQKIKYLYAGHHNKNNVETQDKIQDMLMLSKKVLSGSIKGTANSENSFGMRLGVAGNGYQIVYNASALK